MPFVHTTASGHVFLGGDFLQVGVSQWGSLGVIGGLPSGFTGAPGISFYYDPDGFGIGAAPPTLDSTSPQTPHDRIIFGYKIGAATTVASNAFMLGVTQIPATTTDTSSAALLAATTIATMGQLGISQVVSLGQGDRYFKTTVTVTNMSATETMTDVRFMRNFDPDHPTNTTRTLNDVLSQGGAPGELAAVQAVAANTLSPIILVSNDERSRAWAAFNDSINDPYATQAWDTPSDPGGANQDIFIGLTFRADSLAPGQSTTFEYYTVLDPTIVLADLFDPNPPHIVNLGPALTYAEGGTAILLDTNVDAQDLQLDALNGGLGDWTGASLQVARQSGADPNDIIGLSAAALTAAGLTLDGTTIRSGADVIASFAAGGGTLSISFGGAAQPTSANVDAIARAITYANSAVAPPPSLILSYTLNDGDTPVSHQAVATQVVNIANTPVILALNSEAELLQGGSALRLDANVDIVDTYYDGLAGGVGDYGGASLFVRRQGGANANDQLGFDPAALAAAGITISGVPPVMVPNIAASWDGNAFGTNGTLGLVFQPGATSAQVDALVRAINFHNTSPTAPNFVMLEYVFTDNRTTTPDPVTGTINVTIQKPPVITAHGGGDTGSVSVMESTGAQLVTTVTVTDPDTPAHLLVYTVVGGADASLFNFPGVFGAGVGDARLFINTATDFENPPHGDNLYEVVVRVSDPRGGQIDEQTITVNITNRNEAPVVNVVSASGIEDGPRIAIVLSGSDPDAGDAIDSFIFSSQPAGGSLYLTASGGDPLFGLAAVSNSATVYFQPDADWNGSTTFDYRAIDGFGVVSPIVTATIDVTPVNDAPSLRLGGGIVTTDLGLSYDTGADVAVQVDGRIVVGGSTSDGSGNNDFALVRYTAAGALDTTFGGDSIVTTDFGATSDTATSVAVQADGKILLGGSSWNGGSDFAVARYNADGSLDTTFDGDGLVTTAVGAFNDYGNSITVQADGKILVGGTSVTAVDESEGFDIASDFALVRYNADGSLDTSFGGDGRVTTDFDGARGFALSVTAQADGKILLGGYSNGIDLDFALVRYNADGSLDTSFDGDGRVTTNFTASGSTGASVTVQADGKILVGGSSDDFTSQNFALVRYNTDGSLDTSFDGDGRVTTDFGLTYDSGSSVTVQADGKILLGGFTYTELRAPRIIALPPTIATLATAPQIRFCDGHGI